MSGKKKIVIKGKKLSDKEEKVKLNKETKEARKERVSTEGNRYASKTQKTTVDKLKDRNSKKTFQEIKRALKDYERTK